MPGANETLRVMGDFMAIAEMPAVVSCTDCTHIAIQKPSGDRPESNISDNSRQWVEVWDEIHRGHQLGDVDYPCRSFLLTPLANPQSGQEQRYNITHTTTRNCIKWAFGVL